MKENLLFLAVIFIFLSFCLSNLWNKIPLPFNQVSTHQTTITTQSMASDFYLIVTLKILNAILNNFVLQISKYVIEYNLVQSYFINLNKYFNYTGFL